MPGQREMRVSRVPVIQEVGCPQDMHGNYPTWVSLVSQGHRKKEKLSLVKSQGSPAPITDRQILVWEHLPRLILIRMREEVHTP